jgi:hypothetical protein
MGRQNTLLLIFTGDFMACPVLSSTHGTYVPFNQPLILKYTSMYGTMVITVYLPHAIDSFVPPADVTNHYPTHV